MKKLIYIILSLLVIAGMVLGCTASPQSSSPTATVKQTVAPATTTTQPANTAPTSSTSAQKVIQIKFAEQDPPVGWGPVHCWQPWMKKMEESTGNRIKFEYYPAQTLFKGTDAWEGTKNGTADVAWMFHGYWANMTPLADVISLPFMPVPSAEAGSAVLWQLYEKYPSLAKQFSSNHVQLLWTSAPYFIISNKKQIKTLEDMNGLKIRSIGGPPVDAMKALGASPMLVPMPDCYMNLQKGVMDAMGACWEPIEDNNLFEAVKYYTYVPMYTAYFSISWNKQKWDSLPKDIQEAIMKNCGGLVGSKYAGANMFDSAEKEGPAIIKKAGIQINEYTLPPDEVARWRAKAGEPLWDAWVKKMEANGYPEAKEILNTAVDLLKNYK